MSGPLQREFAAALLAADRHVPASIRDHIGNRFAVYRNNVQHSLIEALAAAYPAVKRIVGDEFFAATAREFARGEAVRAPSLALYGKGFSDFLRRFPPSRQVRYLADVAALERYWLEALHAADRDTVDAESLRGANDLTQLRFESHPATRLLISEHPVVSLWRFNTTEPIPDEHAAIEPTPEAALVTRKDGAVQVDSLNCGQAQFIGALLNGQTVQAAHASVAEDDLDFDLAPLFARLLSSGAFTRTLIDGDPNSEQQ